jgi:hypothetical protein
MQMQADPDSLLNELEAGIHDQAEAVGALVAAADAINRALQDEHLSNEERTQRLRKWVERLFKAAGELARRFAAVSFTITVSFPAGVSVSVTFDPSRQ